MERQSDLSQSGQALIDSQYTEENSPIPINSENINDGKYCDTSQVEVVNMDDGSIRVEVEKEVVREATNIGSTLVPQIKHFKSIEGTHSHIKNGQHHLCTNTPFPSFYNESNLFLDRTDYMKNRIHDLINRPTYPNLEFILEVCARANIDLSKPVKTRFLLPVAKILFCFETFFGFYYASLTPFDCNLLRTALLSKFQIRGCPCSGTNCFDMSRIIAVPHVRKGDDDDDETNRLRQKYSRRAEEFMEVPNQILEKLTQFNHELEKRARKPNFSPKTKRYTDDEGLSSS